MGDVAALCLAVASSLAVVSAVVAVRRLPQRPLWGIAAPTEPVMVFVPSAPGFLSRAGPPPPALLQVFRL